MLVNSQLACLPPVGILNQVMFIWIFIYHCLFGLEKPQWGVANYINTHSGSPRQSRSYDDAKFSDLSLLCKEVFSRNIKLGASAHQLTTKWWGEASIYTYKCDSFWHTSYCTNMRSPLRSKLGAVIYRGWRTTPLNYKIGCVWAGKSPH